MPEIVRPPRTESAVSFILKTDARTTVRLWPTRSSFENPSKSWAELPGRKMRFRPTSIRTPTRGEPLRSRSPKISALSPMSRVEESPKVMPPATLRFFPTVSVALSESARLAPEPIVRFPVTTTALADVATKQSVVRTIEPRYEPDRPSLGQSMVVIDPADAAERPRQGPSLPRAPPAARAGLLPSSSFPPRLMPAKRPAIAAWSMRSSSRGDAEILRGFAAGRFAPEPGQTCRRDQDVGPGMRTGQMRVLRRPVPTTAAATASCDRTGGSCPRCRRR